MQKARFRSLSASVYGHLAAFVLKRYSDGRKKSGADERNLGYTVWNMKMNRFFVVVLLAVVPALAQDKQVVIERVEINGQPVAKDFRVRIKTKGAEFEAKTNADGFIVPGEALTASTKDQVDVIITVGDHVLDFSDMHTSNFNVHWQLIGINTPPFDPPSDADFVYFIHFAGEPGRVRSYSIKYDKKPKSAQKGLFEKPERLVLNGIGESDPDEEETPAKLMTENFYPIGWSRDGKFAYFVEPPDEACSCYFAKIVIQDMRTDKILWEESYVSENLEDRETEDLDTFWPPRQKEYSAKLHEHGIEPAGKFTLLHPSIEFEGDVLTPKIEIRIKTDGVFEVDGTVTVSMHSRRLGTKAIRRDVYRKNDVSGFRGAEISGSLMSPFEPRVAVVIVEEHRGYEGPPNITRIKVSGSTLKTGFKK